jgi:predicted nucleic acid-binding protein
MSVPDAAPESCFVDTNIWLYAFIEGEDRRKTARAKELLEASRTIIVSTQVINEVCVNLLKKAQFPEQQVQQLIESF